MSFVWMGVLGVSLLTLAVGCGSPSTGPVKIGELAPAFALNDSTGANVQLAQFRGQIVVLFFYPKDSSRICTREACLFRDSYEVFQKGGAIVIGISSDTRQSHEDFAKAQRLPFPLLVDEGGKVRTRYGVPRSMGLIPGRVTYVIDKDGVIRHLFNSQLNAEMHVTEALRVVRALRDMDAPKP